MKKILLIMVLLIFSLSINFCNAETFTFMTNVENIKSDKELIEVSEETYGDIIDNIENNGFEPNNNEKFLKEIIEVGGFKFLLGESIIDRKSERIFKIKGSFQHCLKGFGRENDLIHYTIKRIDKIIKIQIILERKGLSYTFKNIISNLVDKFNPILGGIVGMALEKKFNRNSNELQVEGDNNDPVQNNEVAENDNSGFYIGMGCLIVKVAGEIVSPVISFAGKHIGKQIDGDWTPFAVLITKVITKNYLMKEQSI